MRVAGRLFLLAVALAACVAPSLAATPVAVFNFQMKSDTPDWKWLEKGLSDRITTDFVSERGLSVVARDEMQAWAQKVKWTPEMALLSSAEIQEIWQHLQIQYVVTGVFTVSGDRITVTAQIVEMLKRQEVARKEVSGSRDNVLELQRQVSAELLSWFSKKPVDAILEQLPVWTRSLPAARVLYEGIDLYDQGRYGEAWLKFRQASRADPQYIEAQYFVGKMYYFMDRYEHARRAMEKFVYLNSVHPRVGDALKEYLHTYEKLDTPAETLLEYYRALIERHPNALVFNELNQMAPVESKRWLQARSGQLLGQIGRPKEATLITTEGHERSGLSGWEYRIAALNAMDHHMRTGELVLPEALVQRSDANVVRFAPGQNQVELMNHPGTGQYIWCRAIAPPGQIFKTLHFYLIGKGTTCSVGWHVHKDSYGDVPVPCAGMPIKEAFEKGFRFDQLPPSGMFQFHYWHNDDGSRKDADWSVDGIRIVAEFEPIPPDHGAIEAICHSTHDFKVLVDGRFARGGSGLIGLLAPGRHAVEFAPYRKTNPANDTSTPLGAFKTEVEVKPGEVTRIIARLPWKEGSPLAGWSNTIVGLDYPGYDLFTDYHWSEPQFLLDDDAIRIVWARKGDLWTAVSTDGENYSRPARLPMPISSAWLERSARCLRDESGRYVLVFISDRDSQHLRCLYTSWSRDFVHWSEPAKIPDRSFTAFDVTYDSRGRFLCTMASEKEMVVLVSRDAHEWKPLAALPPPPGKPHKLRMIQKPDGSYEMVFSYDAPRPGPYMHVGNICDHIAICRSKDAQTWSPLEKIAAMASEGCLSLGVVYPKDRTFIACFEETNRWVPEQLVMLMEGPDGKWGRTRGMGAFVAFDGTMAWHPKWGYLLAWCEPPGMQFAVPPEGPFVICGPSLDPFFAKPAKGTAR
jgi:TolB-like protein